MNKTLVKSREEFDDFVRLNTGYIPGHGIVKSYFWFSPEKYPCVVVWHIEYDGNGPDELTGDFVYLDDFND